MANRTAYYHGLAKCRNEDIKPFKVQEPQVLVPADKTKILSVGLTRMTLVMSAVGVNIRTDRTRLLSDRRIRILRPSNEPEHLRIDFDIDAFVDKAKGQCVAAFERILAHVESVLRAEVYCEIDFSSARIECLTAFRIIAVNGTMSRLMGLLFLLSENRPAREFEVPIETQPGVPFWSLGKVLIYDKRNGKNSSDRLIAEKAGKLDDDLICVEVRMDSLMGKNPDAFRVGHIVQNLDRLFGLFSYQANEPFGCSQKHIYSISVNGLESYLEGLPELVAIASANADIRPFKDQRNRDCVVSFVKLLNSYSNAYDGFEK